MNDQPTNDQPTNANDGQVFDDATLEEVQKSDQFAETLQSLEKIIERHANQLEEIRDDLSKRRQMLRDYLANDKELVEIKEESKELKNKVKARKTKLEEEPQAKEIKFKIKDMKKRRREIKESLSNHLVNHHRLTNSRSFDTSEGTQWEYAIKARVKSKP